MRHAKYVKPLTIAMEREMYRKIKRISDAQKVSMAALVRAMTSKALEDYEEEEKNE